MTVLMSVRIMVLMSMRMMVVMIVMVVVIKVIMLSPNVVHWLTSSTTYSSMFSDNVTLPKEAGQPPVQLWHRQYNG